MKPELVPRILSKADPNGRRTVSPLVASVKSLSHTRLEAGSELLLDYGRAFWTPEFIAAEYCACCFSRHSTDGDPLIQCSGPGRSAQMLCSVSRHRQCFPQGQHPTATDVQHLNYYCPNHLPAAIEPPRRLNSAPLHDPWTPPPAPRASADVTSRAAAPGVAAPAAASTDRLVLRDMYTPPPHIGHVDVPTHRAAASVARSISFSDHPPAIHISFPRSVPSTRQPSGINSSPLACHSPVAAAAVHELAICVDQSQRSCSSADEWELSQAPSTPDMASEHSSAASSDADGASFVHSHRSKQRTFAAPSMEDEQEAASVLAASLPGIGRMSLRQLRVSIRTAKKAAAELTDYSENYAVISDNQRRKLQYALDLYKKSKMWFFPKERTLGRHNNIHEVRRPSLAAAAPAQAEPVPMDMSQSEGQSIREAALDGGVLRSEASGPTADRWRDFGQPLQHDWAEYRSCCGRRVSYGDILDEHNRLEHSSHSIVKMWAARLNYMKRAASLRGFCDMVRRTLLDSTDDRIPWMGGQICFSCFRAVLGRGQNYFGTALKNPDERLRSEHGDMTASGGVRKTRKAPKRARVINLLRTYSQSLGHHRPNPEHKDTAKFVLYLPHKRLQELAQALSAYEMQLHNLAVMQPVNLSQLKAARTHLVKEEQHHIVLGSTVSLMRCATCDVLDKRSSIEFIAEHKLSKMEQARNKYFKQQHVATMQRQRDFFDSIKKWAMERPDECWCLTLDGMDQSKTQLPHCARWNKDTDPLTRMKVHAEGGFCFGGPCPIMGLLNFADLRKDASLCVMTVERMLDIQFERLQEEYRLKQLTLEAAAQARAVEALNNAELAQEMKDEAAAAPSVHVGEGGYPENGIGMHWPKRLHLTFDNAAGECKNQWMFRYLGLLVLHGVVREITVSTLLVGHTHDIVDQLFSIWARMLRVHDAVTFEKMRTIFRDRYISRIKGLVNLMKKRRCEKHTLSPEAQEIFEQLQHKDEESAAEWNSQAGDILHDFTEFVRTSFAQHEDELAPHVELQSMSIDVKGWLQRAVAEDTTLPELKNIDQAHNFGIEKDKDGNVHLYNKYLCDSTERCKVDAAGQPIEHHYLNQATGSYTTRALLYTAADGQLSDPFRSPPLRIDTDKLRVTAKKYREMKFMNCEDSTEFELMLQRLDAAQALQVTVCSTCSDLAAAYSGHGVIHRPKGADEVDKEATRVKSRAKNKAWKGMIAHLYDPNFAEAHHAGQVIKGWWSKWLQRVKEHIQPAYEARGYFVTENALPGGLYDAHPSNLVMNGQEAPWLVRPPRVDIKWLHKHGIPRPGQMAVVRSGTDVREPFYIAEVIMVRGLTANARQEVALVQADEASRRAQAAQAEAVLASKAAAADAAAGGAAAEAAVAVISPAAARQAGKFGKPRVQGPLSRNDLLLQLKEFEVTVRYWDLHPSHFHSKLHLHAQDAKQSIQTSNDLWWTRQCRLHGSNSMEELQAQLALAVADKLPPPPAQPWVADLYKNVAFISQPAPGKEQLLEVNGASLIIWGPLHDILCAGAKYDQGPSWKVKLPCWRVVWEDLTELNMPVQLPNRRRGAAAGPAAGDDTEQERVHIGEAAAAAEEHQIDAEGPAGALADMEQDQAELEEDEAAKEAEEKAHQEVPLRPQSSSRSQAQYDKERSSSSDGHELPDELDNEYCSASDAASSSSIEQSDSQPLSHLVSARTKHAPQPRARQARTRAHAPVLLQLMPSTINRRRKGQSPPSPVPPKRQATQEKAKRGKRMRR